jgi:uncharacterized membrane protein
MTKTIASLLFFTLTACTSAGSGASCPTADAPTYGGFARAFFGKYCTACHSATARDRHGAPPGLDFDTEAEIARRASAIDAEAAAGPDGANTDMPDLGGPVLVAPSLAEREHLGQFLACERRP